ncbi:MAG TPA: SPASM domain-containing protein [Vicinamibacterales bacterium]|nr:SPASM domain-containing protein [Vicinamibacterales bacterium]HEX2462765.1 SPASM domain-containing protein [Vicinamibacterales bacterium]
MRISRYVFAHQVEPGWWGLYTPFEHGVCFVSDKVWTSIKDSAFDALSAPALAELTAKKIVVTDGFDETFLDYYRARTMTRINAMYLVVVQRCNLACRYCVVENNVSDPERLKDRMDVATANAAVDFFARLLDGSGAREARVTYYGGEPQLNPSVIKATLPRIRNIQTRGLTHPVEAVMITNGTIYHEEIAELFRQWDSAVCISIDGMAEQHDAARVTHSGRPTHSRIVENLKRYQDKGLRLGISCTIGKHNVDSLAENARFFVRELGITDIEFQMPYQVPDDGNAFYVPMSVATDQLLRACDVMLDELGVNEYTTLRRLESFISGHWRHRDCGAAGGQIVVSPTGRLGPCHSLVGSGTCFSGSVNDPDYDFFEDPLFAEWSSRMPVNMSQCEGCPFIALCGGGCPYNALTRYGTIWEKDPQVCPYLEKLVPWILERLWFGGRLTPAA